MIDPNLLAEHYRDSLIEESCSFERHLCFDNFSELSLLSTTVEDLIVQEETKEVARITTKFGPRSGYGHFWSENYPYWWDDIIAPQFRSAFLITLMGAVELHLTRLAESAGVIAKRKAFIADGGRGDFYKRVRQYLKRRCAISGPVDAEAECAEVVAACPLLACETQESIPAFRHEAQRYYHVESRRIVP